MLDTRPDHDTMCSQLRENYFEILKFSPTPDRLLAGVGSILGYIHALGLRRPNGGPVTWRMVARWRKQQGFPMLPAAGGAQGSHRYSSVISTYAVVSWALSRVHNGKVGLFVVWPRDLAGVTQNSVSE